MAKYVFVTSADYSYIIECEPAELWLEVQNLKYPKDLATITRLPDELEVRS